MQAKRVVIVSPALARANNGNWQTARRWAHFLRERYRVTIALDWSPAEGAPDLLIALHARRSAASLAAFKRAYPQKPSVLVLTGTDLYRDIRTDPQAQQALAEADSLVLLQEAGLAELAPALRTKARVIYQSAAALRAHIPAPGARKLDICMIGHLRAEKDPLTFMRASFLVRSPKARLIHIGGALEAGLGAQAEATQAANPHYRWLGNLAHGATRQRLKRSHAMVIASHMEGGANVIIEALTSSVPVLASDISGNRGMLGEDYCGYFPVGDAPALARLIEHSIDDPAFYGTLREQCAGRAALFTPQAEQAAVRDLVDNLLSAPPANQLQKRNRP
ncbi:MAG: selenoneine biosynthesis selenosugar synthase SenB [Telluria sp.]|nr:selenoneine biosynthesis selenosugar synthase SenB [Telluria sp.]